jgi:flagellar motor component MotA
VQRAKPKAILIICGEGCIIIMKKTQLTDLKEEWEKIEQIIEERNRKYGPLTEEDVKREVEAYRRERTKV